MAAGRSGWLPRDAREGILVAFVAGAALLFTATTLQGLFVSPVSPPSFEAAPGGQRDPVDPSTPAPNVLLVVTDDQRAGTMTFLPRTLDRLNETGVRFERAYVTTPLCCPSRATILTGQTAARHGVIENGIPLTNRTVVDALAEGGYRTGLFGKYMNTWQGHEIPAFDRIVGFPGGKGSYTNATLSFDGTLKRTEGYLTDILARHAMTFLNRSLDDPEPFFLMFTPTAPHLPATPAPQDEGSLSKLAPHRPPSFNEEQIEDKPAWVRQERRLEDGRIKVLDSWRQRMLETLASVDRATAAMLDRIEAAGERNDTLVIFTSDNGFLWGEHRLTIKGVAYEESVRVPLIMSYPRWSTTPRTSDALVANTDIAPTILDAANLPPPHRMDGSTLAELFETPSMIHRSLVLEAAGERPFVALHDGRYVYIEHPSGEVELYDVVEDPYQLESKHDDRRYALIEAAMDERLDALRPAGPPRPR